VTVCTDKPQQIKEQMSKHGCKAIMLSDRECELIDKLGIRNQGIHSGMPGGAKALPIPTTVLIDATGIVRWIDQAENYQRRSDPDLVLGALHEHLGSPGAAVA